MRGQRGILRRYAVLCGQELIGIYPAYEEAQEWAMIHDFLAYHKLGIRTHSDVLTISYGGLIRYTGGNNEKA